MHLSRREFSPVALVGADFGRWKSCTYKAKQVDRLFTENYSACFVHKGNIIRASISTATQPGISEFGSNFDYSMVFEQHSPELAYPAPILDYSMMYKYEFVFLHVLQATS